MKFAKGVITMRIVMILVAALAAMVFIAGCPKVKISSPISVGPSGPTQIGIYLDEQWNSPLQPAKVVLKDNFWEDIDWDATWEQNPNAIRKLTKGTFNIYVFPSSIMFGYTMYALGKESTELGTYIGDIDFGSSRDPKPTAKIEVTVPRRGRLAIIRWAELPGKPPEEVYLLEW